MNPFAESTGPARHAAFAELATRGPVQRMTLFTGVPVWLVTGYDEARQLLAHPDVVRSFDEAPHRDSVPAEIAEATNRHLLSANPPDHTRLRRLVSAAFTRRRIEGLEPRIREIGTALLDDVAAAGAGGTPVDLVASFGYPLPITVIAELIGVPLRDREDFRRWSTVVSNGPVHPAETYVAAATAMVDCVRTMIEDKRASPADDLLSDLVAVRDGGDRLSADELSSMVFLLLAAGHETTASLITCGAHALLTHPDQLGLLRAEPARIPAAVEELLRYDGPVMVTIPSVAAAPIEIGGVTIQAGDVIVPALAAANRDPGRFAQPSGLDVTRTENSHIAFGHGIHHCLGAPLARLEGRIALDLLLTRFPRLRLADPAAEPLRGPGLLLNGLSELLVLVD